MARGLLQSCSTTLKSEVLTCSSPLYLMKPNVLNLFMKKFTRERVVPIGAASSVVIWSLTGGQRHQHAHQSASQREQLRLSIRWHSGPVQM
jgi:hypothetical protein